MTNNDETAGQADIHDVMHRTDTCVWGATSAPWASHQPYERLHYWAGMIEHDGHKQRNTMEPRQVRVDAALAMVRDLRYMQECTDKATAEAVHQARAEGVPWAAIGASLGITRQAAQKRYDRS